MACRSGFICFPISLSGKVLQWGDQLGSVFPNAGAVSLHYGCIIFQCDGSKLMFSGCFLVFVVASLGRANHNIGAGFSACVHTLLRFREMCVHFRKNNESSWAVFSPLRALYSSIIRVLISSVTVRVWFCFVFSVCVWLRLGVLITMLVLHFPHLYKNLVGLTCARGF
jgi:hypothetical protein